MNLSIVGPCGVGKSTVAQRLAKRSNINYLDFDALGMADMERRRGQISPFSVSKLDLKQSYPTILVDNISVGYILDIGGDTVFRKNADNDERLEQIIWLKRTCAFNIVVLDATKDILLGRFISTKKRRKDEFAEIWQDWVEIARPYWQLCGDIFIDTSFLTVDDVIRQIETKLKKSTR